MNNSRSPSQLAALEEMQSVLCDLHDGAAHHIQLQNKAENIVRKLHEDDVALVAERLEKVMVHIRRNGQAVQAGTHQTIYAWMPPPGRKGCETALVQAVQRVRRVGGEQNKPAITKLRNTWLGRFYIGKLKHYAVARWIVQWSWRNGYLFFVNHLSHHFFNRIAKGWRPLAKLSDFAQGRGIPIYQLADSAIAETAEPAVFPVCDQGYLETSQDRYEFPEIYVATINNAMVYGGSNLVLADGEVICHDLYDVERDYTSEELHGRILIDPSHERIRWLLHDEAPERIAMAAAFVDACAGNYAHWMTEVLTRIALFCAEERFRGVPIVVNDGLHKNIMESLFLVAGSEREIITLSVGSALAIDKLYLTSVAGYVPFDRRTSKLDGHSHGMFSPRAFESIRNKVNIFVGSGEEQGWPEKIFLRRDSGTRKITNGAELERLMVSRGYEIVEPEKLSFSQQVSLLKNAKAIVAPTGAAICNAIFCNPGTRVAVLMAKHEDMIYRYWCNMLTPIGIEVSYVLGNIVENTGLGIHGDFAIEIDDVICLLNTMEG